MKKIGEEQIWGGNRVLFGKIESRCLVIKRPREIGIVSWN